MLPPVYIVVFLLLPQYVHSSCCRLPFTDGECQVKRQGPHRYQIMPDRRSGLVIESTECHINTLESNYRKVVETKNYCNDCPGLLIFHTNSSEIFLFPEYLERILEGRTTVQRKNVVILTTSLVGAYDLDFTFLSRYYDSHPVANVPSIYVDLQMPVFDPKQEVQPNLRLRLPTYNDDKEGESKITRQDLMDPLRHNEQVLTNIHQLPYLYHFDIEKHRHSPSSCTFYDVEVASATLNWKVLDSGVATCHTFMPYFGLNKCFATGFTRLFCPIEESISKDDHLQLSPYLKTTNRVEHLTMAVTGGHRVYMSLNNGQMRPAEQVKILLLQGHLAVTDVNLDLPIRVEYGWNCNEYGLAVPAGFSATRYRRFDGDNLSSYEGNNVIVLPPCFEIIPNPGQPVITSTILPVEVESNEEFMITSKPNIIIDLNITNATIDNEQNIGSNYWKILNNDNSWTYIIIILVALIPLCMGVFYRVYCSDRRRSKWTLDHAAHTNPAYANSKDDQTNVPVHTSVDSSTQTTDTPIRI